MSFSVTLNDGSMAVEALPFSFLSQFFSLLTLFFFLSLSFFCAFFESLSLYGIFSFFRPVVFVTCISSVFFYQLCSKTLQRLFQKVGIIILPSKILYWSQLFFFFFFFFKEINISIQQGRIKLRVKHKKNQHIRILSEGSCYIKD